MTDHLHTGVDHFLSVGIMAWLFLNALKIFASWLATQPGALGSLGCALGGTV